MYIRWYLVEYSSDFFQILHVIPLNCKQQRSKCTQSCNESNFKTETEGYNIVPQDGAKQTKVLNLKQAMTYHNPHLKYYTQPHIGSPLSYVVIWRPVKQIKTIRHLKKKIYSYEKENKCSRRYLKELLNSRTKF